MMNVKIICIGTLKEKYWKDAVSEYSKRMAAFCNFTIIELSESKIVKANSQALIDKALGEEATSIIAAAAGSTIIPLCIEGERFSSEGLSKLLNTYAVRGISALSFVIGSSHGLGNTVKNGNKGISMSEMTFPHQLARVMLCEQLYRAFQIQLGTKYHK